MSIVAINRGEWERYTRDLSDLPPETQEAWKTIVFMRRRSDGVDFNDVRSEFMTDDAVTVAASRDDNGNYTIVSAAGGGMPAYPDGLHLFTVHGWVGPVEPLVRHFIDGSSLEVLTIPEPAPPVPSDISRLQYFQQLAVEGAITNAEALAAVRSGVLPVALAAIVEAMPDPVERFATEMLLSGAAKFERAHLRVNAVWGAMGRTPVEIDDFFRAAAQL